MEQPSLPSFGSAASSPPSVSPREGLTPEQRASIDEALFDLFPVGQTSHVFTRRCIALSSRLLAITPRYGFLGLRFMMAMQLDNDNSHVSRMPMGTSDDKAISLRVSDVDPATKRKKIAFKIFVEGGNGGHPYTTAKEELRDSLLPLINKIRETHGVYESGGHRVKASMRLETMTDEYMWPSTFAENDCVMLQEASQQRSVFQMCSPGGAFHLFNVPGDSCEINPEIDSNRAYDYFYPEGNKDTTAWLGPMVFRFLPTHADVLDFALVGIGSVYLKRPTNSLLCTILLPRMQMRLLAWQPIPWDEDDWTFDGPTFRTSVATVGSASVTLHRPSASDDMQAAQYIDLSVCVQCCGMVCKTFGNSQFAVQMWCCSVCSSHIATPSVPYLRMILQSGKRQFGHIDVLPLFYMSSPRPASPPFASSALPLPTGASALPVMVQQPSEPLHAPLPLMVQQPSEPLHAPLPLLHQALAPLPLPPGAEPVAFSMSDDAFFQALGSLPQVQHIGAFEQQHPQLPQLFAPHPQLPQLFAPHPQLPQLFAPHPPPPKKKKKLKQGSAATSPSPTTFVAASLLGAMSLQSVHWANTGKRKHDKQRGRIVTKKGPNNEKVQSMEHNVTSPNFSCVSRPVPITNDTTCIEKERLIADSPLLQALRVVAKVEPCPYAKSGVIMTENIEWENWFRYFFCHENQYGATRKKGNSMSASLEGPAYDHNGVECKQTKFVLNVFWSNNKQKGKHMISYKKMRFKFRLVSISGQSQKLTHHYRMQVSTKTSSGMNEIRSLCLIQHNDWYRWLRTPAPPLSDPTAPTGSHLVVGGKEKATLADLNGLKPTPVPGKHLTAPMLDLKDIDLASIDVVHLPDMFDNLPGLDEGLDEFVMNAFIGDNGDCAEEDEDEEDEDGEDEDGDFIQWKMIQ